MGTSQEQALRTENFGQNQVIFRKYTAVDGSIKNKIITAVKPVFLYPLMYQLTVFGQVSALTTLHNILTSYGAIDEINLEENAVKMMRPYDPTETLARLIEKLVKGENSHVQEGRRFLTR